MRQKYLRQGYDEAWIKQRQITIATRHQLTDEWKQRGVQGGQYGILTAVIHRGAFDLNPTEHKQLKGVDKGEVRDRMLTLDNQTENFLTLEKKNVKVDFFVKWRIVDTGQYYQATRGEESSARTLLTASINRGLRDDFANRTIQQALSSARGEVTKALAQTVEEVDSRLGISIVDVRVKRIDFPDDVRDKVYERMRAERTRVATELRAKGAEQAEKIRAEADREATVMVADAYGEAERVRGEGDAKAAEIYARAYGQDPEFYRFYRSLLAYRDSMRGKDVLVLEPDSEFFRYFNSAGGSAK
jgi:membrane protease subunit HflC